MPCSKCKSDFTLLTWKLRCLECSLFYCSKCLKKTQGVHLCEKCTILNKRPPEREKLMELKSKDIQSYLNRRNISTYGFVEKAEIVDLFYKKSIPTHSKKSPTSLSSVFGGSVPNLVAETEERLSKVASNLESNLNNIRDYTEAAYNNLIQPNYSGRSNSNNIPNNNTFSTSPSGSQRRHSDNASASSNSQNTHEYQQDSFEARPQFLKLSDIHSIEEIEALSVKQLKQLLSLNRVNYKGVVERNELLEKTIALWIESHKDSGNNGDVSNKDESDCCKICMDAPLECVILECGHIATCVECGKQLSECPICRQYVSRVVRIFKA
ncbi:E3 ubiquitin-protein ligase RNF34 [Agrilus planipennis]|uniref:E3 ubiquitin-protein ligase RNF34 n=1 Tax=Agrilus planipennis TaxID=224129 RepID=A0A1W4X0A2_AGRPL|nr:E3 ubiquitin-protein ligase RNF34 [Agrilus planipennis]